MDTGYQALGVFILVVFTLIILLSRPKKAPWYKLSEYTQPLSRKLMMGSMFISMGLLIFVCFFKPQRTLIDPDEVLEYSNVEGLHYQTFWACETKLAKNPYDLRAHYFLNLAYEEVKRTKALYEVRDLLSTYHVHGFTAYERMAETGKDRYRDLGFFGMGMIRYVYYDDRDQCRQWLDSIRDKKLPFVNYLYSLCLDDYEKKAQRLELDIVLEPSPEAAAELARVYAQLGFPPRMANLVYSDKTASFVPTYAKLDFTFREGKFFDFFIFSVEGVFRNSTALAIGCSFFILALWFGFLFTLDVFEREKPKYIAFALLGGGTMAILCQYLYALFHYLINYHLNDSLVGDFFYSVFVIGGIEEFVKIVPLLVLMRFTKEVNEPIDYIFFAGLGALGFSIVEDIQYFNHSPVSTIYSRAIFTSFSHIADSAIVAYFIVRAKYRDKQAVFPSALLGFLLACLIHGVYDFFILNKTIELWVVPFAVLLVESWWLVHAINNCLNNSPFYSNQVSIDAPLLAVTVSGGLSLLISFVFLHISLFMSEEYAVMRYFYALLYYFYPLFFFNICIKKIDIFPGHWEKLKWKKILNPAFFFAGVNPKYYLMDGKPLILAPLGKLTKRPDVFPLRARILKREKINDNTGWFRIETERPIRAGSVVSNVFLMRAEIENTPYEHDSRNASYICVVKPGAELKPALMNSDLIKVDSVSVQVID